jgi:hypothetical protein
VAIMPERPQPVPDRPRRYPEMCGRVGMITEVDEACLVKRISSSVNVLRTPPGDVYAKPYRLSVPDNRQSIADENQLLSAV